jgi:flagellin
MAMTINTNVVSINAQRNLSLSGGSLATSMQRLSSGLRVNSAKDDAAGLAIAERMTTQVRGLTVAARNANDGISLAQTAEGALGKVGDMLQRMRELAVQASNATNSKSDREALQAELVQLRDEVDRVAKTTTFNGAKLLDGSFSGGVFQVGANAGDNITVGALANTKVAELSNAIYGAKDDVDAADIDALIDLNDPAASMTSVNTYVSIQGAYGDKATAVIKADANMTKEAAVGNVIAAINSKTADTGVTAFLREDGAIAIRSAVDKDATPSDQIDSLDDVEIEIAFEDATTPNTPSTTAAATLVAGGDISNSGDQGIDEIDIGTQAGAWEALERIDGAIDQVNKSRADLGAIQTRFEKSIQNIESMNENLTAARGRIIDTDFAAETANLSRTQILQQAGTAMVAQANQLPQNVLSLLQ